MSEIEEANYSEDEVNPKAHKKLLQAVSKIGKTQHIRKPERSEPVLAQDEFHLVKSSTRIGAGTEVSVNDLVSVLNKTSKHLQVGKELTKVKRGKKILKQPLEKPVAERIKRTLGYDRLRKDLSKWDAAVEQNRIAEHQVFPLQYDETYVKLSEKDKGPEIKIKSALRQSFEAIQAEFKPKEDTNEKEDEQTMLKNLTKKELIARRKELAYMKIRESQKSAKARLQSKIKSKKYHKLLKREKMKEQMKEFELLQKTNPEAALEKLDKIEKNRVLERASLRHKNTGTWAKNLQIRAKYDKDVRKDLADQLAISRELTAKERVEDESVSESEKENSDDGPEEADPFNPWLTSKMKKASGNEEAVYGTGYRKYWSERNKNEAEKQKFKDTVAESVAEEYQQGEAKTQTNIINGAESSSETDEQVNSEDDFDCTKISLACDWTVEAVGISSAGNDSIQNNTKKAKSSQSIVNGWTVESIDEAEDFKSPLHLKQTKGTVKHKYKNPRPIDDIFDEAEDKISAKSARKLKELAKYLETKSNNKEYYHEEEKKKDYLDLSFKQRAKRPDLDEELIQTPTNASSEVMSQAESIVPNLETTSIAESAAVDENVDGVDPKKFIKIKTSKFMSTDLSEATADYMDSSDEEEAMIQAQQAIAEAFEDDDVVADFTKETAEDKQKNSTELDLSMPGWGCWAGSGISKEKQRRRFVLKFPEPEKRRDENKEKVYINENPNKKLKEHLVSDLPFPFTCVKDYEASIRTPVSSEFIPETAFRLLTRPATVTKMGKIIEPLDKDALVKKPKRPQTIVDMRIEALNKKMKT